MNTSSVFQRQESDDRSLKNTVRVRNIALTLAYDGTDYVGWQVQPNGLSIQAVVTRAIEKLTGEKPNLLAAGRTDAGVHAIGQVASFTTHSAIPSDNILRGIQHHLPGDVVVRDARDVDADFHARYSAKRKRYRYVIHNGETIEPFVRRYVHQVHGDLDVEAMQHSAEELLGTHDFRCFESHFPNRATSARTVMQVSVDRCPMWPMWSDTRPNVRADADVKLICFEIVADGFLYKMVRAIVGTLIRFGRQSCEPGEMRRIIESQDRSLAGETAPPQGLFLVHVDYE